MVRTITIARTAAITAELRTVLRAHSVRVPILLKKEELTDAFTKES
jgi:hypothetical protein